MIIELLALILTEKELTIDVIDGLNTAQAHFTIEEVQSNFKLFAEYTDKAVSVSAFVSALGVTIITDTDSFEVEFDEDLFYVVVSLCNAIVEKAKAE